MDSSSSDTPQSADENIDGELKTDLNSDESQNDSNESNEPAEPQNEFDRADAEVAAQFKDFQVLRFVRVRFPGNNRSFAFYIADKDYHLGQKVLAMSDRGMAVGFVNSSAYELKFHRGLLPVRSIVKVASKDDLHFDEEAFRQEKRLREICDRAIERNQLDMALTQVELSQMGKKAIFYFTAPTRVDFRGLVHELVGELKMRIELRQISVRDRAAAVGGLGPCGRELCCSSFLAKYGNVGIKLAKNQDLSLNSSKINGVCGQLKCCLTYEDEVYQEKRKKMPRDNALVKTKDGNVGKVIRLHVLIEQFETISPDGVIRRYVSDMWDGLAEGLEIPKYFENGITDNSKTVIGMDKVLAEKAQQHERDIKEAKLSAQGYADEIFEKLFGSKTLDWSLPEISEPNAGTRKVITPDEEEEIIYVAPEDELLDDEDGDDLEDEGEEEVIETRPAPQHQQHANQQQRPQQDRSQQPQRPPQDRDPAPQRIQERPRTPGPQGPQQNAQPPREGGEGGGGNSQRRRRGRGDRGGGGGGQGNQGSGGPRPPRS